MYGPPQPSTLFNACKTLGILLQRVFSKPTLEAKLAAKQTFEAQNVAKQTFEAQNVAKQTFEAKKRCEANL